MDDTLQELRRREEEDLAKVLATKYQIPYLDTSKVTIDLDSLKIIPEREARENFIAVLQSVGKKLQIAVNNPESQGTKNILENLSSKKYELSLFLVSKSSLERAFQKYREIPRFEEIKAGVIDISQTKMEEFGVSLNSVTKLKASLENLIKQSESKKASEALELILAGSISIEASDVHLEPESNSVRLRLRLDGVLQDISSIPTTLYQLLLSRVKLISEIKLNIHDKPQDGRFTIKTHNEDIEVRTSILPGPYGESAVLRILLPKNISKTIKDLGMHERLREIIESELQKPNGMILATGPTGSGKTTTLYTFLKKITTPKVKVITIEDPIEYHLQYVSQTQVDSEKGYDFGNGLRSILRQDPDVIMVGEIRDLETAEIAMHASLTGHLVFSTLHTNDAAGTIPRLIDLGVKTNIIAPAINVTMAQRLVRTLCDKCRKEIEPTAEEIKIISENLENLPKGYEKKVAKNFKIWKEVGCEKCNLTGFSGRIGIFEAFLVDDEMERLILKNPPEADIREAAKKQGMMTMFQDGILKVLDGITSFDELNRVVSEE